MSSKAKLDPSQHKMHLIGNPANIMGCRQVHKQKLFGSAGFDEQEGRGR